MAVIISKAIGFGTAEIRIEYKDGYQEIFAINGCLGTGIGRIESDSEEARALRQFLCKVEGKTKVRVDGDDYQIRVDIYESFG